MVNYVDTDPTPTAQDYACGRSTYNGHKGIDFAVRDMEAVRRGVAVIAASPGFVVGVRDGMKDISFRKIAEAAISGRECGNGVLVQHDNGWSTQYCHMRQGSIVVKKGDGLVAGQVIGMVGQSGKAEFPHLHLQVKQGTTIIDPFIGLARRKPCGPGAQPLWKPSAVALLPYQPTAVYNVGFAIDVPTPEKARNGDYDKVVHPRQAANLVLWADVFWIHPGDKLVFHLIGPKGKSLFTHEVKTSKLQARRFAYAGLPRTGEKWPSGKYKGEIRLVRGGADGLREFSAATTIELR